MSDSRQMPRDPVQQFATDSAILKIRQQRKDHYLSTAAGAETVANDVLVDNADVAWQYAASNIFAP